MCLWDSCGIHGGPDPCSGCWGWMGFHWAGILANLSACRIASEPPAAFHLPVHPGVTAVHCPEGLHLRVLSPLSVNPALHPK